MLENINEIIEYVQTHSIKETAKHFNTYDAAISKLLKEKQIILKKSRFNTSKLGLDIDYFNIIDSPSKAYWLGFICADGYINKKGNKLAIIVKDLEILEKFKRDIKSEHKISQVTQLDKRTNKIYIEYSLQITNELFVTNLINNGITNKKSLNLQFPNIDTSLYSYFIAGLFDGDGSIHLINNKLRCSLISTKEVLSFISDLLCKQYNFSRTTFVKVSENVSNVWKFYINKGKDLYNFFNYIYQGNPSLYLSRKYNFYKNNINKLPKKMSRSILQFDKKGNFMNKYDSLKDAENKTSFKSSNIIRAISSGGTCGGFYWKYFLDNTLIPKNINET